SRGGNAPTKVIQRRLGYLDLERADRITSSWRVGTRDGVRGVRATRDADDKRSSQDCCDQEIGESGDELLRCRGGCLVQVDRGHAWLLCSSNRLLAAV